MAFHLPALAACIEQSQLSHDRCLCAIFVNNLKCLLVDFEGVAEAIARIAGYTYLLEATRVLTTTSIIDQDE